MQSGGSGVDSGMNDDVDGGVDDVDDGVRRIGQGDLFADRWPASARIDLAPGAVWLRHWLPLDRQLALTARCREIIDGPAGGYVPTVRGGGRMHVRMTSLGRHWNPLTYTYEASRSDYDGAPVAPVPAEWVALASQLAADAGFSFTPDVCLVNFYDADGRMGLHQDKDETAASIAAGLPVVSLSLGDTARFLFGGLRRREPVESMLLASGDVFVFGGPARLRYHGVSRIVPGSAPEGLGLNGRFNLTFRQF
jgi:alkylated DNA repair protein (DNA oxidative demethylase)